MIFFFKDNFCKGAYLLTAVCCVTGKSFPPLCMLSLSWYCSPCGTDWFLLSYNLICQFLGSFPIPAESVSEIYSHAHVWKCFTYIFFSIIFKVLIHRLRSSIYFAEKFWRVWVMYILLFAASGHLHFLASCSKKNLFNQYRFLTFCQV